MGVSRPSRTVAGKLCPPYISQSFPAGNRSPPAILPRRAKLVRLAMTLDLFPARRDRRPGPDISLVFPTKERVPSRSRSPRRWSPEFSQSSVTGRPKAASDRTGFSTGRTHRSAVVCDFTGRGAIRTPGSRASEPVAQAPRFVRYFHPRAPTSFVQDESATIRVRRLEGKLHLPRDRTNRGRQTQRPSGWSPARGGTPLATRRKPVDGVPPNRLCVLRFRRQVLSDELEGRRGHSLKIGPRVPAGRGREVPLERDADRR
jgi:hypothetical protein